MADPATGCTCGSGAHPRQCKLHPELYRLHIAELNAEAHMPDEPEAMAAMHELSDAIMAALQKARKENERLTRLVSTMTLKCRYFDIGIEPNEHGVHAVLTCGGLAWFTCCDYDGPVCEKHKCRCSKPLTEEQHLAWAQREVSDG